MSKRARVPKTLRSVPTVFYSPELGQHIIRQAESSAKPQCKQCKEGKIRRVISAVTGRPFDGTDATTRVVRFMGQWVCLDHFRIENTRKLKVELPDHLRDGDESWSLVQLFPNRAARRRAGHHHGV